MQFRDGIKPGPTSALKPHKHKLAENKVTTEKQPSFKASNIPLWSQKRWKLYFWHSDWKPFRCTKKSSTDFWRILKGCECFSFTLVQLSWRPVDAKKKNSLFLVFLDQYTAFVRTSVSGVNWFSSAFVVVSSSCTFWSKLASALFFLVVLFRLQKYLWI